MAWLPHGYEVDGKYALIRPLAEGGMGQVYEAEDRHLGRRVALKLLPERQQDDMHARERLAREGKLAAKLQHANIVRIYEVGSDGELDYVAMELLDGEDLHARIRRLGPLPIAQVDRIASALAEALVAMHAVGIVHRDLKPRNLFLANDGASSTLKVLDFGVAKSMNAREATLTRSGQLIGTLHYMAPEQIRGAQHADARSDLWAFGAILYECATGLRPFDAESAPELLLKIASEQPAPLSSLRADLPPSLVAVIERALQRDPTCRPQSAVELRAELRLSLAPTLPRVDPLELPPSVEPNGDSRIQSAAARGTRAAVLGLAAMIASVPFVRLVFLRDAVHAPKASAAEPVSTGPELAVVAPVEAGKGASEPPPQLDPAPPSPAAVRSTEARAEPSHGPEPHLHARGSSTRQPALRAQGSRVPRKAERPALVSDERRDASPAGEIQLKEFFE